jgi:phosphate transport system permease protein
MNVATADSTARGMERSARFHRWRARKDKIARWLVGVGGISVIFAIALIFFYLAKVVFPLFTPAATSLEWLGSRPDWARSTPRYFAVEEQQEIGIRIAAEGSIEFFHVQGAKSISTTPILPGAQIRVERVAEAAERTGLLAVASVDGRVFLRRIGFETQFDGGVEHRRIEPSVSFPFGQDPQLALEQGEIRALALSDTESGLVLAVLDSTGHVLLWTGTFKENLMTGETSTESVVSEVRPGISATAIALSSNHDWLYIGDASGSVQQWALPGLELVQTVDLKGGPITTMAMLLGGISVLAGDTEGVTSQLFPVRDGENRYSLALVRQFHHGSAPIRSIFSEARRKGFLTLDEDAALAIYHSTAGRLVHAEPLASMQPRVAALAPRADGLLIESMAGDLSMLAIDNQHPEVSFASLWQKVWYENYSEPEYVWQSSASGNDFEPKFSLTPLVFGTLKAALYAMLFAIPLALMAAVYTAYFMAPRLRQWVKPGIEIMAALPTVILGFLAGLWLAPLVEENLAGVFALLIIMPPGIVLFACLWQRYAGPVKSLVPEGYVPLLQIPVMMALGWLAWTLAGPVQFSLFGMDMQSWLSRTAGIGYDQRNALIVGIAMGFAVIPTLFSIAEDALFGVPRSLSNGSLALGATPWQTLVRVVIPTASPGIFSALMIGLGRAVGETMIVLMATGNTPVMNWNMFEGMRTLAANIAVEMPESAVNSSHYRILFLAALVLFLFTFVVNTGAEVVRQRLRERYSSL